MTNITIRISEIEVERLKKIYGKHTPAAQRAVESWFVLRQSTLRDLKGIFTENELKLLIDNENGSLFNPETDYNPEFLAINVKDGCDFEELDKKWDVSLGVLIEKILKMKSAECLFLHDWIGQFWEGGYYKESRVLEEYIKELL